MKPETICGVEYADTKFVKENELPEYLADGWVEIVSGWWPNDINNKTVKIAKRSEHPKD